MKKINYIYSAICMLLLSIGCSEDVVDLSYADADNLPAPANVSATLNVSQDNSGTVSITPSGENASEFEINYGDGTEETVTLTTGQSTEHIYTEGNYDIQVMASGIGNQKTTAIIPLMLSFRAPENIEITAEVDGSNPFQINVSATADYAASFQVYFGDGDNEAPTALALEGMVSHEYPMVGDYTVRVVALSGGTQTSEETKEVKVSKPTNLPIDFEIFDTTVITDFDGGELTVTDNPDVSDGNGSSKVGQMVKKAGQTWGGSLITLSAPIDFSEKKVIKMKVWSPRVGANVLFKVENLTESSINYEQEVATTTANAWEEIAFDYSGINDTNEYQKIILIFDNGTMGDGSSDFTFYVDDIKQATSISSDPEVFPMDFELPFNLSSFDGGEIKVIANPETTGNSSANVIELVKGAGAVWAGSKITVDTPYEMATSTTVTAKIWSPRAGLNLLMKFEDATPWPNTVATADAIATTTTGNAWEEITFSFAGIDTAIDYHNLVLIMDNGTAGDGSANYTVYLDDFSIASFLDSEPAETLSSFDGGEISIISNPQTTGNSSSNVVKLVKGAGAVWAGSKITYDTPYPVKNGDQITMKVWSPRAGLVLLMKFEDATPWPNNKETGEAIATTSSANEWEELTFTLSGVDPTVSYTNIVLIMDNGTQGDGTDNYTLYIDDINNAN